MELYWPLVWGGAAIVAALFLNLFITAFLTWRLVREPKKPLNQPTTNEADELEHVRKQQEIHKDFLKVMNYNETIARQRKKVQ
jgi:hypothetical protein